MPLACASCARIPLLIGAALLAGCLGSLARPYEDHGPKNLILAPSRTSTGFFMSRTVRMDIYRGSKIDQAAYLGTVRLTGAAQLVGLPIGTLLLHIGFQENGPLMSAVSVHAQRALLTVRPRRALPACDRIWRRRFRLPAGARALSRHS